MKQDLMLICHQAQYLELLQIALEKSKISVTKIADTQNAMASMAQYTPAFLFLDFDMDDAAAFLQEVTSSIFFRPAPYILIAATFAQGPDRATVLNLGADACIEKPIDPAEVVALIHAVLRREHKIARLGMGRLLSCIEHKDLIIDPLRRVVTMYARDGDKGVWDDFKLLLNGFVQDLDLLSQRTHGGNRDCHRLIYGVVHSNRQAIGTSGSGLDGLGFSLRGSKIAALFIDECRQLVQISMSKFVHSFKAFHKCNGSGAGIGDVLILC